MSCRAETKTLSLCCSVAKSCPTLQPHGLQDTMLPCPISQSFLRFMSIESVILSHCLPPLSPFAFSLSQHRVFSFGATYQLWSSQSTIERVALEQHSVCMCAQSVTQSYPTLGDPMDCSPPGSSVHGIFQARILEWAAISFSNRSSQPRD